MLTQKRLKEVLRYNRKTGVFTWRVRKACCIHVGDTAGRTQATGYREITIDGRGYRAHRLAWLYVKGRWPKKLIDHKNGVKDDNRWSNIREADAFQNQHNQRVGHSDSSSGLLGVAFHKPKGKWFARISVQRQRKFLGYFTTANAAHSAYVKAKVELHPFAI